MFNDEKMKLISVMSEIKLMLEQKTKFMLLWLTAGKNIYGFSTSTLEIPTMNKLSPWLVYLNKM